MLRILGQRSAVLLICSVVVGCGVHAGYLSSDRPRTWPDSYYYAALRTDAWEWQAVNDSGVDVATATVAQTAILADLPLSILADTAVLPVLLCTAAANALSDRMHGVPPADGGWRAPDPLPPNDVAANWGWSER